MSSSQPRPIPSYGSNLAVDPESEVGEHGEPLSHHSTRASKHGFSRSFRNASTLLPNVPTVFSEPSDPELLQIPEREQERLMKEQRSLLRDNEIIPGKRSASVASRISRWRSNSASEAEHQAPYTETTSLIEGGNAGPSAEEINELWEDAILAGAVKTTWRRETKVLTRYSAPLIVTYLLQYSLTVASVFTLGHMGKVELGAVSLASMTASITGYSVYHGLATSLDTLCAQAYGSGRKQLVGLQLQRMVCFLTVITIPMSIVWYNGELILSMMVPEKETARLAGLYLRIIILGMPGYYLFESGKRFVQAQGLFNANLYCLVVCAPLNAIMNYVFVWKFGWGFVGAPIAVVITETLLPICLFSYVYFVAGRECWGGFSSAAFRNWWPMISLALPGLVMVVAEFLAFEVLTLAAAHISSTHLAAQSVLSTIAAITYQFPFPLGVAASTRVANLVGATLSDAGKTSAKVAICGALLIGVFNSVLVASLRHVLPVLFTSDPDVAELVASTLPITAAFQLFDAFSTVANGILRGLGRQDVGGVISLVVYYIVGLPISFWLGFGMHWNLIGLWTGVALGLVLSGIITAIFIVKTDWQRAVDEAVKRNEAG